METKFVRNRTQTAPFCPCGKSNKDGKFAPSKENPEQGFCHSCAKFFDCSEKIPFTPNLIPPKPIDYHPIEFVKKSSKNENNNLIKFLKSKFDSDSVDEKVNLLKVGSAKHWTGATVFWQIDNLQRVRYGKVMLYDPETGKRVKEPFNHFTNIHTILKMKDFNHKQCLFGSHLLPGNKKPIALVESEKTAIVMSIVDESYLWLATGGKGNFNYEFLEPIKGKKIMAFPDAGEAFWTEVSVRLNDMGFNITISKVLDGKPKGYDLADAVLDELEAKVSENHFAEKRAITTINGNSENQLVTNSIDKVGNSDNLKVVLEYAIFPDDVLKDLAKKIIPEQDSVEESIMIRKLIEIEKLDAIQSKDLLNIMRLKNIIDVTGLGRYFLNDSTPY
ncbi:DUF6371 domain-containing protein [Epilithonimonas ginsengisoli]|uniref:DUF6371 domain-containing protein n=1 Tax=Epilithonimonas ginsengisoli TaxID=1245592 RepID=A0ABU4JIP7_9FLAO|nr:MULTISPECIES: DUF6371 domain-containing protein [Chryseobacterium group]MBV6879110.1 hypothetical protein [Epilithonimonas sp. FP105]MDW8549544.1 DUF6371 domain-containing protein [Epilithonimonas ginsengisoli]OAH74406.1 hypothetical protein AXA65_06510 [Chryseobacterium sp. FP211-J200]